MGSNVPASASGTVSNPPKVNISVKDAKFDTPLTDETSAVWFRRLRVHAETLQCSAALTDPLASDVEKRHAKFLLTVNLPDEETHLLDANPTAKELWDKLLSDYAGTSYIRQAELYQRLLELRPKREKLSAFLQRSLQLRAELVGAGIQDEVLISAFFLIALRNTTEFHDWVLQQLQTDPPKKLSELVSNMRTTFRNLLDDTISAPEPSAHSTQHHSSPQTCSYCHRNNHQLLSCFKLRKDQAAFDERQGPGRGSGRGGGRGHGRSSTSGRGRNAGRAASNQVAAFIAIAFRSDAKCTDEFLLDSCATHHMVCDKSYLTDFRATSDNCYFADSSHNVPVEGKGTMTLINHEGKSQVLKDVLFVPSFSSNLISASKADANGAFHSGGRGRMRIHDAVGNVLVQATLRDGLYHAECSVQRSVAAQSFAAPVVTDSAVLMHRRFGHVGMSTLAKMAKNDVVSNLPSADKFTAALKQLSVCGPCKEGGQKASPFPRTPVSSQPLKPHSKLHIDIAGPRQKSLGGAQYFTVMRCEASHFLWVFTHKTKDESSDLVMSKISSFIADGHRVKELRCDRDPVFLSKKMKQFLHSQHISLQPTSGYSPQENGHAERAIGVLKERMQCLLSDSGLSDALWAEALWHACYLQNISSSTGSTTPWELIKGVKPDASTLRIWGCTAWKLIPREKRSKSSDTRKSEKVRYLGVAWPNFKASRVLTGRGVVEQTRHLAFDESSPPACDSRTDFSSFLNDDVQPTVAPSPVSVQQPLVQVPAVQAPVLPPQPLQPPVSDSASDTADDGAGAPMPQATTPSGSTATNPLYDADTTPLPPAPQPPPILSSSSIPAPRASSRSNKGQPPVRYHEKYLSGLPTGQTRAKAVSFLL
jgi:GAG-pre-integrase domain